MTRSAPRRPKSRRRATGRNSRGGDDPERGDGDERVGELRDARSLPASLLARQHVGDEGGLDGEEGSHVRAEHELAEAQHRAVEMARGRAVEIESWPTHDPTLEEGSRESRGDWHPDGEGAPGATVPSVRSRIRITCVSGSPRRQLNSTVFGVPCSSIIRPA